jgi:single-strand DNA-binding protein
MSYGLNRAMVLGNLTRDPETRTTPAGLTVVSFSVATSRRWKDQKTGEMREATEFHNIVAWSKLAQTIGTYCHKGSKVYIDGRLQTRSWDDPTGVKKSRTEIVAETMIMLDSKGSGGAAPANTTAAAEEVTPSNEPAKAEPVPTEDEINIDDIPF